MNFLYFLVPIITLLITTIPSSFSDNSSVTEHGFFGVDQDIYTLAPEDEILVKISGIGNMPAGVDRERANITVTHPDSTASGHRVFSGSDGYFELLLPLSYDSQQGVYKVFASFHGHVLGEVYFTVERISLNDADTTSDSSNKEAEHIFAFRTSMFEVETDSLSYEKNSIIHIFGAVPTQPKLDLTLQIIDPINNIILINQITPNPDGTFEDSVNTNSPLWKFEGDYNIRINHNEQDLYSTFSFSIPSVIAVPNPIESSPEPPKIKEPEVIVEEPVIQNPPPAITSPPPPPPIIQEPDEFTPSGLIVLAIIFFIIAIIIKKKRGKKSPTQTQLQTHPSISRQSDSQAVLMQSDSDGILPLVTGGGGATPAILTPTKIDDIKVAIEKIDSLIRRNKNKIGECNAERTYYEGPRGGDWVTKHAMIGYYELRIGVLEDLNEDLSETKSYCEDENTKFAINSLKTVILGNQDFIRDNHESIRERKKTANEFGDETSHLVLEFLEKRHQEYQTEINSCEEIKQIIENSIKSGKSEKQLLINEYKSYAKKLEDSFNKVQKLIDEQSSNWSQYEITTAKNTLNIYKETVDSSVQHIHDYSDEDLTMQPKVELQESIQHYKDIIKDTEDSTENILSELEKIHADLPKPDPSKYTDNVDDKISEKYNFITKAIAELKTDLLENRQYYEENSSNSNLQELLDVLDRLESNVITKNKDTYEMIKTLPDEATEDMRQRFLQELTSISDEPLKEISSSLKELKKKRQEKPDSDESDKIEFGEDAKSFDSELERRKKQVEEDYYAEKRAERENRDP